MPPSFRTISYQHKLQGFFPAFYFPVHCGLPIPGTAQGQAGWGWEQPGLVEGAPVHGRGLEQHGF